MRFLDIIALTIRNIALERGNRWPQTSDFQVIPLADVSYLCESQLSKLWLTCGIDWLGSQSNIITDAGVFQVDIVEAAERYHQVKCSVCRFRPMAGSHKSSYVPTTLFENAYYIFTPTSLTRETTIPELRTSCLGLSHVLWRLMRLNTIVTSQISHFPTF